MHGNDDKEVPVQSAYELEKKIKQSRFIVVPGGGHIFTITHSQTTNNVIQFWLRCLLYTSYVQMKAGCIWQWSLTCGHVPLLAGQCRHA